MIVTILAIAWALPRGLVRLVRGRIVAWLLEDARFKAREIRLSYCEDGIGHLRRTALHNREQRRRGY